MLLDPETSDGNVLRYGACCYLVRQTDHSHDTVRSILSGLGLSNAWLTVVPTELRGEPWQVVSLQLLKDAASEGGWPIASDEVGQALSDGCEVVLEFLATPGAESVRLATFVDGVRQGQPLPELLPQSDDPIISRLAPEEILDLQAVHVTAEVDCGEYTEAICANRALQVPSWVDKGVDVFRFTERSSPGIDDEDDDRGRLCFVALDLARLKEQVQNKNVSEGLAALDFYSNQRSKRFLGPMQADLPLCQQVLRELPGDEPLRETPGLTDLAELFALVNTWISAAGNRLAYLDEVFFPLLNLASDAIPEELDPDELPAMEHMDLLAAMADQLPYHAPEGELLESFDDGELTALTRTLELDDHGGALWLLQDDRLVECLDRLDPTAFHLMCEKFMQAWFLAGRDTWTVSQDQWLAERVESAERAIHTFFTTYQELSTLLAMARLNDLQVALLFYE